MAIPTEIPLLGGHAALATMRAAFLTSLGLAASTAILVGCPTSTPEAPVPLPFAECVAPPTGVPLDSVDTVAGIERRLDTLDLAGLPERLPLEGVDVSEARLVRYLLELPEGVVDIDVADAISAGPLGLTVLAAYRENNSFDVAILRQGLHRFYACERDYPAQLEDFYNVVADFRLDPVAEIVDSRVKGLRRRLRRNGETGVFVAETLFDALPGEADRVRETEILLTDRRADGAIDFLEYDGDGKLRRGSTFETRGAEEAGSVPFSCIACHDVNVVAPAPPP